MKKALLVFLALALPLDAPALEIQGHDYPNALTVEGKALKLVGVGLREKWFFKVYTMGAYTESGKCDPTDLVNAE